MLVGQSNKVVVGTRGSRLGIPINDRINRFLGTISNIWSNPANWSLNIIPSSNYVIVVESNLQLTSNVVVRGIQKNNLSVIDKNGFTIKDNLGNDLE